MPERDEQEGPHRTPQGRTGDDELSDEPSDTPQGRTDDGQDDEHDER